jgi:hypothetical protein
MTGAQGTASAGSLAEANQIIWSGAEAVAKAGSVAKISAEGLIGAAAVGNAGLLFSNIIVRVPGARVAALAGIVSERYPASPGLVGAVAQALAGGVPVSIFQPTIRDYVIGRGVAPSVVAGRDGKSTTNGAGDTPTVICGAGSKSFVSGKANAVKVIGAPS